MSSFATANSFVSRHDPRGLIDRRRSLRVRQARPIKIFHPVARRFLPGKTLDISSTGLRVELPTSSTIADGAMLTVHVGLSRHGGALANRRQMIPARVVWVRHHSTEEPATAGLEFINGLTAGQDAA